MKTVNEVAKEVDMLEEMAQRLLLTVQENFVILVSTLKETQCVLSRARSLLKEAQEPFNREIETRTI